MSSKKEEERNEKIIRGLLKLPPNRRCINCNSMGPQYVCTNFWTFVCVTCSGIHREFTHRVKSVSMAKFTSQEVDALQKGGNQRAKEIYLKDCDPMQMKFPDSRNADKIREFIKSIYVDKTYSGDKAFEKPPRDMQNHKKQTEDHRRASSYHSYSQSPPYDYQYEERLYGKQPAMLTRKPGSDKGHYEGKLASFLSSSLSQPEQTYDERFGNESCGSRVSDFSASSPGEPFRQDSQSPNFQDLHSKSNPNAALHTKRTASSSSIVSVDSVSLKSGDSGVFANAPPDLFDGPTLQKAATVAPDPPIDLFANVNSQPSSENVGWATFDSSPIKYVPHTNGFNSSHNVPSSNETYSPFTELFSGDFKNSKLSSDLKSNNAQAWNAFEDTSPSIDLENTFSGFDKIEVPYSTTSNSQSWLSFDDNTGNANSAKRSAVAQEPQTTNNPFAIDDTSEVLPTKDWVQNITTEVPNLTNPFEGVAELLPSAVVPLEGGNLEEKISTNPFDMPLGTHSEALNMFMDMGSLQEALPDPRVPDVFLEAFSGCPTSSAQGAMMCLASQAPSSPFQNIAPTVVAAESGNPFA